MDENRNAESFDELPERLRDVVEIPTTVARRKGETLETELGDDARGLVHVVLTAPWRDAAQSRQVRRVARLSSAAKSLYSRVRRMSEGSRSPYQICGSDTTDVATPAAACLSSKSSTSNMSAGMCPDEAHSRGKRWL